MNQLLLSARLALADLQGKPEQPRDAVIDNLERALSNVDESVRWVLQAEVDVRDNWEEVYGYVEGEPSEGEIAHRIDTYTKYWNGYYAIVLYGYRLVEYIPIILSHEELI